MVFDMRGRKILIYECLILLMYKINWDWLGGFFDGEGCVDANIKKNDDYKIGYEFSPKLKIAQTGKRGSEIIKEIEIFLKNQNIKCNYKKEVELRSGYSNKSYLVVNSNIEVKKCTSRIRNHTRIKEPQLKILENEIMPIMKRSGHLKKNSFMEIVYWKEVLDSYKGGNNRSKYNIKYFESEWGIKFDKENIKNSNYGVSERDWGSIFNY